MTATPHEEHQGTANGLDYRLFLPDRRGAEPPALIVMLHGCLQDAASFRAATTMLDQTRDMAVLFPEQTASANPQRCWNWFAPMNQRRDSGEAGRIAALTRAIIAEHDLDAARVYVVGISAGGMMAAILAAAYPDLYAALGVHSAGAFPTASTVAAALAVMAGTGLDEASAAAAADAALAAMGARARSMPVVVIHGTDDTVVNVANAEQAALSWWRVHTASAGADTEPVVDRRSGSEGGRDYVVESWSDSVGGDPVVELWRITGLGHAWSGGVAGGSYADAAGPDAARIMRGFLTRHRLP